MHTTPVAQTDIIEMVTHALHLLLPGVVWTGSHKHLMHGHIHVSVQIPAS
jgi:hypothetical protein